MSKKFDENPEEKRVSMDEYMAAKSELDELRRQHGIAPKEGRLSRIVSNFFERRDAREKIPVNRKKFMLLALFTGWVGGHRFYAHHYKVAVLYLLLCWTGFSVAMTIIDFVQFIPYPVDENGDIYV
ncbi:MAG: TM2 domain-containing protein [Eubacteriales bacterium]|nr:TM2 domain-containing protein [Eubacteriales bacterium]